MIELFGKHRREFARALRDRAWERSAEGIYFPRQHAFLHGEVLAETKYGSVRCSNRVLTGALDNTFLGLLTAGGVATQLGAAYIAPWGFDVDPTSAWEAPFIAVGETIDTWGLYKFLGELGDAPEGYDEATRPQWVYADVGGGKLDNSGAPAAFTMRTASSIEVYGFALVFNDSVKLSGQPYPGPSSYATLVDTSNWEFPEIFVASSGYLPPGAESVPGGGLEDSLLQGRILNVASGIHGGDPHEGPFIPLGSPISAGTCALQIYDPSGDSYYDTGLGHWVDPSGDDMTPNSGETIIALVRFPGAPLTFADMDPLNITWALQLS